jgi:ADP-heptose:LPS heptosyltransferase
VETAPWIRPPAPEWVPAADVAVSFGVGENPGKRVSDGFEFDLVQGLLDRGLSVLLDSGAPGTAEAERAASLEDRCRGALILWSGSFAPFAAAIGRSRLYVGYDSAGQHVAAACGVPRITVFNGFSGERFVARWRPEGAGFSRVLFVGAGLMEEIWGAVESAIL